MTSLKKEARLEWRPEDVGAPCAICGEQVDDDAAEMHDADMLADPEMFSEARGGIVHAECGIAAGWRVS